MHQLPQFPKGYGWVICLLDLPYQKLYRNDRVWLFHQSEVSYGYNPQWELWVNLVLCHSPWFDCHALGNGRFWQSIYLSLSNLYQYNINKLIKSWYAAHVLCCIGPFQITEFYCFLNYLVLSESAFHFQEIWLNVCSYHVTYAYHDKNMQSNAPYR